eukprot:gb/GEZN01003271.1/.p1 GENE.gb/GEZN01003271.1/~~gb/GEZN01003271.1/.p1  ORF type:complete len:520 (-),score=57.25 gb/GEZN01003271.1/:488-2047(-)
MGSCPLFTRKVPSQDSLVVAPLAVTREAAPRRVTVGVFGESGAGKTTIIHHLLSGKYKAHDTTIFPEHFDVPLSSICEDSQHDCLVTIWDMAGQEECKTVWKCYAPKCQVCFFVVDASKVASRETAGESIVNMTAELVTAMHHDSRKVIVVFTKLDLIQTEAEDKVVGEVSDKIYNFLAPLGVRRTAVSAKTGLNMESLRGELDNLFWQESHVNLQANKNQLKLVLMGDVGAGKTTFLMSVTTGEKQPHNFPSTIGIDFQTVLVEDKKTNLKFKVNMWDTAGQERFDAIPCSYARNADIVLIFREAPLYAPFVARPDRKEYSPSEQEIKKFEEDRRDELRRFTGKISDLQATGAWVEEVYTKSDMLDPAIRKQLGVQHNFISMYEPEYMQNFLVRLLVKLTTTGKRQVRDPNEPHAVDSNRNGGTEPDVHGECNDDLKRPSIAGLVSGNSIRFNSEPVLDMKFNDELRPGSIAALVSRNSEQLNLMMPLPKAVKASPLPNEGKRVGPNESALQRQLERR